MRLFIREQRWSRFHYVRGTDKTVRVAESDGDDSVGVKYIGILGCYKLEARMSSRE